MRLVVIGGSGLVGSHVLWAARRRGDTAIGTFREHPQPGLERLDCSRLADCAVFLDKHQPDVVVHAAGWTWVDGCEDDPDRAFSENCWQPVRLAHLCHSRGVNMAYISTSYVFDGHDGPYDECRTPNPLNAYGRSKWLAEQMLLEDHSGCILIPRVVCVYGAEQRRKNFAHQVCSAMITGSILRLPSDQAGNPTWAGDIAQHLLCLLEQREQGVWHIAGSDPACSRVSWARHLVAAFTRVGVTASNGFGIEGVPTRELGQKARRPLRAGIISRRLREPFISSGIDDSIYRDIAEGRVYTPLG